MQLNFVLISNTFWHYEKMLEVILFAKYELGHLVCMYCVPKVPMHDFAKWCIRILGFELPLAPILMTLHTYVHCQMPTESRKLIQFIFVSRMFQIFKESQCGKARKLLSLTNHFVKTVYFAILWKLLKSTLTYSTVC